MYYLCKWTGIGFTKLAENKNRKPTEAKEYKNIQLFIDGSKTIVKVSLTESDFNKANIRALKQKEDFADKRIK